MVCSRRVHNRRAHVTGRYDVFVKTELLIVFVKVLPAHSSLLDFSLPVVTALLLGDVYGEHTSRVRQMVLMNRVHFGHWLIADHVERSQPGVSTILVYSN